MIASMPDRTDSPSALVAVSSEAEEESEPTEQLVTLEDSKEYAYVPKRQAAPVEEEEPDEYAALTEIMIGKGDDDLVELPAVPPVDKSELRDVFGILEFIGTRKFPRSERVRRKIRQARKQS